MPYIGNITEKALNYSENYAILSLSFAEDRRSKVKVCVRSADKFRRDKETFGMEDAKNLVKKLLQDPYRAVLLQDYEKILSNRRNRKKMEEIEKELAWYNGKAINYRVEDRQGFLNYFREHYSHDKSLISAIYRSVVDYPSGQEPKVLYFVILFVKRQQQIQEFQIAHPLSELKESIALRLEHKKLVNEERLLSALLERLAVVVAAVEKSIDEIFLTDFLADADKLTLPGLQNRFVRSIRLAVDPSVPEKLLALMKEAGAEETSYQEALLAMKKKDYEQARKAIASMPENHPNQASAKAMLLECCANLGDIDGFAAAFDGVKDAKLDAMYFIYMLQTLVCNADYKKLDTDEFENAVQNMMKSEFNQNANPAFTGLVSRKFVNILLEGLPMAESLLAMKKESGEEAIPEDELDKLYRLQMALQLYPVEEVGNLIDLDYMEEHGVEECKKRLGRQAITMLLEKNPDKSFENIYLAFRALEEMGMMDAYAKNIEGNLENLAKYGEKGQKRAYEMMRKAYEYRKAQGEESEALAKALEAAGQEK